ncbi:MAG: GNAT family N-acetyltransferase [Thermoanaerobaculia bacterium]
MSFVERVRIVEFRDSLVDELVQMWRASFEEAMGLVDPHPLREQRDYFMTEVLPHNAVRTALHDGRIVGFVAASKTSVSQLYVHTDFQRQGVGTLLLDWAKAQSAGHLWLFTFARNAKACSFYERSGFTAIARGFEPLWQLEDVKYAWSAL